MIRFLPAARLRGFVLLLGGMLALAACDLSVPAPPVEQLTPVVGSVTRTPVPNDGPTPTPAPMILAPSGRLWFVRGGRLWTAQPDGSAARAISASTPTAPPAPSPDGMALAFLSDRKLVLLDVETGSERVLAEGEMAGRQRPTWSPDGKQIGYFTLDPAVVGREVAWAAPAAGGAPAVLTSLNTRGDTRDPSFERRITWSGDMRRVAVASTQGPIQVLALDSTASNLTVFGGEPDWSPDFRTLLLTETVNGALALHDTVSDDRQPYRNEKTLVGTRLNDEAAEGPLPRFNADASLILYRAQGTDGVPATAVRARDGSEFLFLPYTDRATWAPDGEWIAYEAGDLDRSGLFPAWKATGVGIIRADGSGQALVLPGASWPAWGK
jgi:Tol biopolymer transport system component